MNKLLALFFFTIVAALTSSAQTEIKKEFHKNGKLKSETPYVDGKINGVKKVYFENGILESEDPMINGQTNGTYKWYFESGMLRVEVDYINGKRNGMQRYYYKSGNIEMETIFKDGEIVSSKTFNDVNPVTKTEVAKVDTFIKKYTTDTCISGDCKNGFGTMVYATGHSYTGNFENSKYQGKGKFTSSDGNVYEGNLKNGKMDGKGIYKWANGAVYEGDWVNNDRTGKGKYTWANGDVYNGDFVNGVQQGRGEMTWQRKEYYIGDWVNGIRQGKGRSRDTENRIKDGDWVNDKFVISQAQRDINEELRYKIKQLKEELEISRQSYLNAVRPNNEKDIERYERARANVLADIKYMENEIYRLSQLIIE
jgi:hypothetical protein